MSASKCYQRAFLNKHTPPHYLYYILHFIELMSQIIFSSSSAPALGLGLSRQKSFDHCTILKMWMLCWCLFFASRRSLGRAGRLLGAGFVPPFLEAQNITADLFTFGQSEASIDWDWPIGGHKTLLLRQVMNNLDLVWSSGCSAWPLTSGSQPSNKAEWGRLTRIISGSRMSWILWIAHTKLHALWMLSCDA